MYYLIHKIKNITIFVLGNRRTKRMPNGKPALFSLKIFKREQKTGLELKVTFF